VDLRSERRAWTLVYVCLGMIDGGTAAVMVRSLFGATVRGLAVDLVLGLVSSGQAWANLVSLPFARRAQGRSKIAFLSPLLATLSLCVALLALVPRGVAGLVCFLAVYAAARMLWAGVDTVRSVIWSVNYPRRLRARVTGRILVYTSLALSAVGLSVGWLLERDGPWLQLAILAAACCGLAGTRAFRGFPVRREGSLLDAERARLAEGARFDLGAIRELLARDAGFRHYMYAMSLFGAGLLSLPPLMIICIGDVLHASEFVQVAVTSSVPVLIAPLAIQPWARFLDRHHVVVYRSVHGWVATAAALALGLAVLLRQPWLLWPGAVLFGTSLAAGNLGWSLGHNDFAPRGEETRYMALHVTLTGVRGLFAPPLAIAAYHALDRMRPGAGAFALLIPMSLVVLGAWEFTRMRSLGLGRRSGA
jgi:hypothetical protein